MTSLFHNATNAAIEKLQEMNFTNSSVLLLHQPDEKEDGCFKLIRKWFLALMLVVSIFGWYLAVFAMFAVTRRRGFSKSQFIFVHMMIADVLVVLSPVFSQFLFELAGEVTFGSVDFCKFSKLVQTYGLTLSACMLLSLALDSYNACKNRLKESPVFLYIIYSHVTAFFITVYLYIFREFLAPGEQLPCLKTIYNAFNAGYSHQLYMGAYLILIYAFPIVIILPLFTTLLISIIRQSLKKGQTKSETTKARYHKIKMTFCMSLLFICMNLPYLIQEILILYFDFKSPARNYVVIMEMITVLDRIIDPYIFFIFQIKKIRSRNQPTNTISYFGPDQLKKASTGVQVDMDVKNSVQKTIKNVDDCMKQLNDKDSN